MKKKLLLIQFRTGEAEDHEKHCFRRISETYSEIEVTPVNSLDPTIEWESPSSVLGDHDGVILGGSGEYHFTGHSLAERQARFEQALKNVTPLARHLVTHDIPTLGICFGHQMLGYFLGTKTRLDPHQAKAGSHPVTLLPDGQKDALFADVPESFVAQYGHTGVLTGVPRDSVLLARGERCRFSAFRHKDNIYGVQFHPELNAEDIKIKMRLHPEYISGTDREEFEKSVKDSPDAERIIVNFARRT